MSEDELAAERVEVPALEVGPPLTGREIYRNLTGIDVPPPGEVFAAAQRASEMALITGEGRFQVGVITAEQVRAKVRAVDCDDNGCENVCTCALETYAFTLRGLLSHPGVSSSARAVIEAALE